jgi:hypothetical protein
MSDLPDCPECQQGKHRNCSGDTWDPDADTYGTCPCFDANHEEPA